MQRRKIKRSGKKVEGWRKRKRKKRDREDKGEKEREGNVRERDQRNMARGGESEKKKQ